MYRRSCTRFVARIMSPTEAIADVASGCSLLVGGFGCTGQPHVIMKHLAEKNLSDLHCVCESVGAAGHGIGQLFDRNQVKRVQCSFLGRNQSVKEKYVKGQLEIDFIPQGTLAERIRAGGVGVPAFYSRSGAGTWYEEHGFPIKYNADGVHVDISSDKKEVRKWGDHWYCLEPAIRADFAFIKAWKADKMGNLVFKGNTVNFNKVMATAGKTTIVEVEEIVDCGALDPNSIVVPCIYIDRIVQVPRYATIIEKGCLHLHNASEGPIDLGKMTVRDKIAARAAQELKPGMFVNLGVGLPCESADFCKCLDQVTLHGENGMLGIGPFPDTEQEASGDVISAARFPVKPVPQTSYFGSEEAFGQIRGGHLDLAMLGGLEVASNGDLANWLRPGQPTTGMGGAMELVTNSCRVVVTMTHTNKNGSPKILSQCTLPLTGKRCVDRIITEHAVFDVDKFKHCPMTLVEKARDTTIEQIQAMTEAPFEVSPDLRDITF